MAAAEQRLSELARRSPLPPGWTLGAPFLESVAIRGLDFELVGLTAVSEAGADAAGSAAEVGRSPIERAYFELLERVSIHEVLAAPRSSYALLDDHERVVGAVDHASLFPAQPSDGEFTYARSNGVALGASWHAACSAAYDELIERDRTLRAWYGATVPERVALPESAELAELAPLYTFEAYRFPPPAAHAARVEVIGIFAFPRLETASFSFGLGAGAPRERAARRAERECLQRLGFLWGENIPSSEPEFAPTASYHQEFYLWPASHERLRAWLNGRHAGLGSALVSSGVPWGTTRFVDLTPRGSLAPLRVAKAVLGAELPLTFGRGHPCAVPSRHEFLSVHPIA